MSLWYGALFDAQEQKTRPWNGFLIFAWCLPLPWPGGSTATIGCFPDSPLAPLPEATTMDVPIGTHLPGVLHLVEQRGIRIGNSMAWRLLARELGVAGEAACAGEYAL